MKHFKKQLSAQFSAVKRAISDKQEALSASVLKVAGEEREQIRIRREIGKCIDPDLCLHCRRFLVDILSRQMWVSKLVLPWKPTENDDYRFPHRLPDWFKDDLSRARCKLCRLLVHSWRSEEPENVDWSTIMYIEVDGRPSLEFRAVGEDVDTSFEICSDLPGTRWLNKWLGGEVAEGMVVTLDGEEIPDPVLTPQITRNDEIEEEPISPVLIGDRAVEDEGDAHREPNPSPDDLPQPEHVPPVTPLADTSETNISKTTSSDHDSTISSAHSTEDDTTSSEFTWRDPCQLLPDTGSPEMMATIAAWLESCLSHHELCKRPASLLPTRVIDVGTSTTKPKLYITRGEPAPYVTLSYCWGKAKSEVLRRHNIKAFQDQIPPKAMPKTIRDAISATRSLGIKFIWIDALCILQDSQEDWLRESANMANIYRRSQLTIAGADSLTRNSGLFRARHVQVTSSPLPCGSHMFVSTQAAAADATEYHVLQHRAWTLQEQIMSTAVVHFTSGPTLWECHSGWVLEDDNEGKLSPAHPVVKAFCLGKLKEIPNVSAHTLWYHLVADFCDRQLTQEADRLAALAGLADMWLRNDLQNGRYLAGLWETDLPAALLWDGRTWYDLDEEVRRNVPSWSWVSSNLPSSVKWPLRFLEGILPSATSHDCRIESNYLSTENKAAVTLHGRLLLQGWKAKLNRSIIDNLLKAVRRPDGYPASLDENSKEKSRPAALKELQQSSIYGFPILNWEHLNSFHFLSFNRPISELQLPLFLVRMCSWPVYSQRFENDKDSQLRDGWLETYYLVVEMIFSDDDNDNEEDYTDDINHIDESVGNENATAESTHLRAVDKIVGFDNSIDASAPDNKLAAGGNLQLDSAADEQRWVCRRAGLLCHVHEATDTSIIQEARLTKINLI